MPWTDELDEKLATFIRGSEELRAVDDEEKDVYSFIIDELGIQKTENCSARGQVKEALLKLSGLYPNAEYYVTASVVEKIRRRFFAIGGQV